MPKFDEFLAFEEWKKFASDLQLMKHRAMTLGLYATAQRLDPAIRMVGFEMSGDLEACSKYEAQQKQLEVSR